MAGRYDLGMDDDETQAAGLQALMSGQVKPEEVAAVMRSRQPAGTKPGQMDWLSGFLKPKDPNANAFSLLLNPGAAKTPAPLPADVQTSQKVIPPKPYRPINGGTGRPLAPKGMGAPAPVQPILKNDRTSVKTTDALTNSNTDVGMTAVDNKATDENAILEKYQSLNNRLRTPEELAPLFNMIRNSPEYQGANEGVGGLETTIKQMTEAPVKGDPYWIKPLLALADSQTGSHLLDGFTPQKTNKDRFETILKYKDDLAKRKGDQLKTLLGAAHQLQAGTDLSQLVSNVKKTAVVDDLKKQTATTGQKQTTGGEQFVGAGFAPKGKGGKAGGLDLTPLEKAADEKYGKDLGAFQGAGGFNGMEADISKLREARQVLHDDHDLIPPSGFMAGAENALGLGSVLNAKGTQVAQAINEVSAHGLKGMFPGAISDSEREFITKLRYDHKLPKEDNIAKLDKAIAIMERGKQHQKDLIDFATKNRTIRGFGAGENNSPEALKEIPNTMTQVRVKNKATGDIGKIPAAKLEAAIKSGRFERVP